MANPQPLGPQPEAPQPDPRLHGTGKTPQLGDGTREKEPNLIERAGGVIQGTIIGGQQ